MPKYEIFVGSCNSPESVGIYQCPNQREADRLAWELAVEDYQMYEGLHGILDLHEVAEEYGFDPDSAAAEEAYSDERESVIEYEAKLIK